MRCLVQTLFLVASFFNSISIQAQQDATLTTYKEYIGLINPAAPNYDQLQGLIPSGQDISFVNIYGLFRNQWFFEDAPRFYSLQAEGAYHLELFDKIRFLSGINTQVFNTDPIFQFNTHLKQAVEFEINPSFHLSIGAAALVQTYRVKLIDNINPFSVDDPVLSIGNQRQRNYDLSAGVFGYYTQDRGTGKRLLYAGLSVERILNSQLNFTIDETNDFLVDRPRRYSLIVGGRFSIKDQMEIELSNLSTWVAHTPVFINMQSRLFLYKKLWIGAGIELNLKKDFNGFYFEAGWLWEMGRQQRMKMGLSYDALTGLKKRTAMFSVLETTVSFFQWF